MDHLEFHPSATVKAIEDDADFLAFLASESHGIVFVPEPQNHGGVPGLKSDFSDFAKWARDTSPSIQVSAPNNVPKIILRNSDVWLPLAFLFHHKVKTTGFSRSALALQIQQVWNKP